MGRISQTLFKLTWIELKIFVREPLGFLGSVVIPVVLFVGLARLLGTRAPAAMSSGVRQTLPAFSALFIAMSAIVSLVTIISIYREGGILRRLRATPLRPSVILTAHVIVKLVLTAVTLVALALAGRRVYPIGPNVPLVSFALAALVATWSVLSVGFVIASVVPTARFAQPIAALVLYPMIAVSGLFFPLATLPPAAAAVARRLPFTAAASLLNGIWRGEGWLAHRGDLLILALTFVVCVSVSGRVFRWE